MRIGIQFERFSCWMFFSLLTPSLIPTAADVNSLAGQPNDLGRKQSHLAETSPLMSPNLNVEPSQAEFGAIDAVSVLGHMLTSLRANKCRLTMAHKHFCSAPESHENRSPSELVCLLSMLLSQIGASQTSF